jgi:hypothetical protein
MGFDYEDAASEWWQRRALSAKAPNRHSFEMKHRSTQAISIHSMGGVAQSGHALTQMLSLGVDS